MILCYASTMNYVDVATQRPIDSLLTYHVPEKLHGKLALGHLVRLDLRTAAEPGIVLRIHDSAPLTAAGEPITTKPVLDLLDPEPVVNQEQIEMARWISARYLAPLGPCLWLSLPPGIAGKRDYIATLLQPDIVRDDPIEMQIIERLNKRGKLTGTQLNRSIKIKGWQAALQRLEKEGVVQTESMLLPPTVKREKYQVAALTLQPDRIQSVRRFLGKPTRESELLELIVTLTDDNGIPPIVPELLDIPGVSSTRLENLMEDGIIAVDDDDHILLGFDMYELDDVLFDLQAGQLDMHILKVLAREGKEVDVSWVYAQTGAKLADLKRLAIRDFIYLGEHTTKDRPQQQSEFIPLSPPRLTEGQRRVWQSILEHLNKTQPQPEVEDGGVFLLHGVTGSGKTEIYLRAIEKTLSFGRQAIYLVPEIALTAQTIRRVMARFPGKVAIMDDRDPNDPGQIALVHSGLRPAQRYDVWQRARAGEIDIIVGTRSALFTPLPDVGLIVLDESHDSSYKQSPPVQPPVYYHARDIAEQMMRHNNGTLIFGSATPSVETYFRAQRGDLTYLHLPDRIMGHRVRISEQAEQEGLVPRYTIEPSDSSDSLSIPLPEVQVVDMRNELRAGNTDIFSRDLQDSLAQVLAAGQQAILFLNRRGASTYVFCRDCGYVVMCPRCDMPMTYHDSSENLHCRHCGQKAPNPTVCPSCESRRIKYFGAGTQHVEAAFRAHFPDARSLRWDSDTAAKPGSHDLILQRFLKRDADVLIGTQMVAKGLDLPLVTLVGVVNADMGMALPDFYASERLFQLLTQVAGRAGRGLLGGRVILQTYQPKHDAVQAASHHDYDQFYAKEIAFRREMGYPPFRRIVRVLCTNTNIHKARDEAQRAADGLRKKVTEQNMTATEVFGPTPCFFSRLNRHYRWQVIVQGPQPTAAFEGFGMIPGRHVIVDPQDIL